MAKIDAFMKRRHDHLRHPGRAATPGPGAPPTPARRAAAADARQARHSRAGAGAERPRADQVVLPAATASPAAGTTGRPGSRRCRATARTPSRPARAVDGVSPIIITSNDFAAAWARGRRGEPLYPVVPGGERQREMAFRAGVNIVMYALTGNYKADQVHVPALLEGSANDGTRPHDLRHRCRPDAAPPGCWSRSACWRRARVVGAAVLRARARRDAARARRARPVCCARQSRPACRGARAPARTSSSWSSTAQRQPGPRRPPAQTDRRRGAELRSALGGAARTSRCASSTCARPGGGQRRHAPVRRPATGAGRHAARPGGRRHHDHRRPGARRARPTPPRWASTAPVHALVTGHRTSATAASSCSSTPRFGIVGQRADDPSSRDRDRPTGAPASRSLVPPRRPGRRRRATPIGHGRA